MKLASSPDTTSTFHTAIEKWRSDIKGNMATMQLDAVLDAKVCDLAGFDAFFV